MAYNSCYAVAHPEPPGGRDARRAVRCAFRAILMLRRYRQRGRGLGRGQAGGQAVFRPAPGTGRRPIHYVIL